MQWLSPLMSEVGHIKVYCHLIVNNIKCFLTYHFQFYNCPAMYHERQRLQFCALHVLNNLFQAEVVSKPELDDICYSLNPYATINPHKSMFGWGNYDVNVLTMALQLKDYQFIWFDKRK